MSDSGSILAVELQSTLRMMHSFQQRVQAQHLHKAAAMVAETINAGVPRQVSDDPDVTRRTDELNAEGRTLFGPILTREQAAHVVDHFVARPCYNGHVVAFSDGIGRRIGAGAETFHYGSYSLEDVVTAPYLLEIANHPTMVGIAEAYLGCTPTIYSLNTWWSFSGHGRAEVAQAFHRDLDDFKFCTLFVLLTDVDLESGAHVFIRRTHRYDLVEARLREMAPSLEVRVGDAVTPENLYRANGSAPDWPFEEIFPDLTDTITGPAGFAFMADTGGFHRGIPLTRGRRLMFWARYGLYRNWTNYNDRLQPVDRVLVGDRLPADERTAYINRCIVAPDA